MQLAILLAVIFALAQGESPAAGPVGGALWRTALTLAGALVAPLAAAVGSSRLVRGLAREESLPLAECERSWLRVQTVVVGLWLVVVAATMYVLAWPRVVRDDWSLGAWPLVDELLILLPVVVPLVLVWSVMYRLQYAAQSAAARQRGVDPPPPRLAQFVWLHVRQHLVLILLPAVLVIGVQESLVRMWPQAESNGLAWWLYVPLLAGMLALLPLALRRIWRTSPLPTGPLREQLMTICREVGVGVRELLVWHTEGLMVNAAVAGMLPGLRYVFLTDGLLARLSPAEVEGVVRHELRHITGRHMPLRMLLLALPLAIWLAIGAAFPVASESLASFLARFGLSQPLQFSLLLPAALATYAILVVGRYSQWLEHDADLAACVSKAGNVDPAAAECFGRALIKILGRGRESRWARWLHPSLAERLTVLAVAVADPSAALRYRRRLALLAWGIVAAYGLAAVVAAL